MKVSGIVCEYNPFHNGHLYHIEETRRNGATHIIAVMSGNFVQRGDVAVIDKFTRANLAVDSGVDMVIELPVVYCLSSAELFARGAVYLLESSGIVNEISFGSECGNVDDIIYAMNAAETVSDSPEIGRLLNKGYTYPRALSEILYQKDKKSAEIISEPNNILAVEYLKALRYFNSDIKPFTVQRKGALHDSKETEHNFASASYIREHIGSAGDFVPEIWADALDDIALLKNLEKILIYKVRTISENELAEVNDMNSSIFSRLYRNNAESLENILDSVKSKNCTMARIKRVLLSALIGITKKDASFLPPYIRVLAFNEKGQELLAMAKKSKKIPLGTSLAKLARTDDVSRRFAEIEATAGDIYSLARKNIKKSGEDYKVKISRR